MLPAQGQAGRAQDIQVDNPGSTKPISQQGYEMGQWRLKYKMRSPANI